MRRILFIAVHLLLVPALALFQPRSQVEDLSGSIWAVPVIDWNASSGLFPLSDSQAVYFHDAETDLLHPNDLGHARLARTLMYQLLAFPCTFE